jgi:hypothetical protein
MGCIRWLVARHAFDPSRHYRNRRLCRVPATKTLDKGFTECRTRQSCENTRQRLCRVSHSAKKAWHTVHRQSLLCRVLFLGHLAKRFAECRRALGKEKQPLRRRVTETAALNVPGDTRQRSYLCRVSARQHSTKDPSLPSVTLDARQRTRQGGSACQVLCRVLGLTLGKECFFAECQRHYTRQRTYAGAQVLVLCRVLWP